MKGFKKFNINPFVRVKLTPNGIKTLIKYHGSNDYLGFPVETEKDLKKVLGQKYNLRTKVLEIQMHEVMHIFGPECFVGGNTQFVENCIYLPEEKLM